MPVKTLPAPCWYATYPGGEDYQNSIHHDCEADARKAAAEVTDEDPLTPVKVGSYPKPCLTARCDGECDQQMEHGEWEWTLHFDGYPQLLETAVVMGWTVSGDQVWCGDDKPQDVTGEVLPVNMDPLFEMETPDGN